MVMKWEESGISQYLCFQQKRLPSNSQECCNAPGFALEILFWWSKTQHRAELSWKPHCLLGMAALSPFLPSSPASPKPSPFHLTAFQIASAAHQKCVGWALKRGQEIHVLNLIEVHNSQGYCFGHLQGIQSCVAVPNFHSWLANLRDSAPQLIPLCSMWRAGWYPTYQFYFEELSTLLQFQKV